MVCVCAGGYGWHLRSRWPGVPCGSLGNQPPPYIQKQPLGTAVTFSVRVCMFVRVCVCACVFAGRDVFNCLRSAGVRNRLYPTALWWRLSKGPDAVWIPSKDLRGLECRNWTSAHTEELCVPLCVDYRRLRVQYTSAILNVPMLSITFWLSKGSGWSFLSCCFWLFICYLIFSNLSSGLLRQMEPGFKAGQIYFIKLVAVHPLALWKTSRRLWLKKVICLFSASSKSGSYHVLTFMTTDTLDA